MSNSLEDTHFWKPIEIMAGELEGPLYYLSLVYFNEGMPITLKCRNATHFIKNIFAVVVVG